MAKATTAGRGIEWIDGITTDRGWSCAATRPGGAWLASVRGASVELRNLGAGRWSVVVEGPGRRSILESVPATSSRGARAWFEVVARGARDVRAAVRRAARAAIVAPRRGRVLDSAPDLARLIVGRPDEVRVVERLRDMVAAGDYSALGAPREAVAARA